MVSTVVALGALGDVLVGVCAAVLQAPGAKAAAATRARERKAAIKVKEGLAAARALEREELLADVLAVPVHLALLFVHSGKPLLLRFESRFLLLVNDFGQPLLEELIFSGQVLVESLVARVPEYGVSADGILIILGAEAAADFSVARLELPKVVFRLGCDLERETLVAHVVSPGSRTHVAVQLPQVVHAALALAQPLCQPQLSSRVRLRGSSLLLNASLLRGGEAAEAVAPHALLGDGSFLDRGQLGSLGLALRLGGGRLLGNPAFLRQVPLSVKAQLLLVVPNQPGRRGLQGGVLFLHLLKVSFAIALDFVERLLGLPLAVGELVSELGL
mmetsp:Transcript_25936/g.58153  ORF Transcript_25936/g.58153 Transcript_25936/m.58153 type:complete len:331 (+) Transcript_25936:350-1342(+)